MWTSTSLKASLRLIRLMATVSPVLRHLPSWTEPYAPNPKLQGSPFEQISS